MAEEIIITGKTFEEAMAQAQSEYSGENVQYEILEMPKKGIFGIGASPAKIKVIISDPVEEDTDLSGIVASIKGLKVTTNKGGDGSAPAPEAPVQKKPEPKKEKPKAAAPVKPVKAEEKEEKPVPVPKKAEQASGIKEKKEPKVIEITEEERQCALTFLTTLLTDMGVDAKAEFVGSESSGIGGNTYPRMEITGEGAGVLIGHHGETLDAIQYLVNLCTHRKGGGSSKDFVKIIVDIENYRRKREETLRSLARRTASKAQKYRRNIVLEPMNPFERRIIHSEIQDIENVSTHSVGRDENRKIVVCYEGADKVDRRRRGPRPAPAAPVAAESGTEEE
ncbi:MAG: KH domain-containing protein [Clostridiales bacterium]|nr:KH domain-containing protein [Clostridiales bacterium]